jgi:hypothetical protein
MTKPLNQIGLMPLFDRGLMVALGNESNVFGKRPEGFRRGFHQEVKVIIATVLGPKGGLRRPGVPLPLHRVKNVPGHDDRGFFLYGLGKVAQKQAPVTLGAVDVQVGNEKDGGLTGVGFSVTGQPGDPFIEALN